MTKKIFITWDDFHSDTKELARKIKADGTYNKIIAISRGGLLPAGILAYELDIRNSQAINISSYDNDQRRDDKDIVICSEIGPVDEKTLIVDDLSDSGRTFRMVRHLFPQARFVSVYTKPQGKSEVDIFTREMPDEWLVFPWD